VSSGKPIHFSDRSLGRTIRSSLYPVYNETGKVTRIAIHARDVSMHI
jgi:hypothetical protein